jgi:biotin transport system substrate-specific component
MALIPFFIRIFLGALFLTVAAQLQISLKPVPLTFQTVGLMLIGLTFPLSEGVGSVLVYLGAGSLGLPVFAGFKGGLSGLTGPTGGYLVGFLVAIFFMIKFRQFYKTAYGKETIFFNFINCILAQILIFIGGIGWLSQSIGLSKALEKGLYPFLIPGMLKIGIVLMILELGKAGIKRFRQD